jgi:hypothetical protein
MSIAETGHSSHVGSDLGLRDVRQRLTLRDLILFLWNEAELTTWRPEFAGRRTWAVVRHHLLRAATDVWVNGVPLARALFIPEPFSVAKAEEIRARRIDHLARFVGHRSTRQRRMLLIGEVKEWTTSAPQPRVVIKHLPDTILRLSAKGPGWQAGHEPNGEAPLRQVMGATLGLSGNKGLTIEEFQIIPMSAEWLPAQLGEAWRATCQ